MRRENAVRIDRRLIPILRAATEREARQQIEKVLSELTLPVVRSVLTYELRRGKATSLEQLNEEDTAFLDIERDVQARLSEKLWQLWDQWRAGQAWDNSLVDVCAYAGAAARNARVDYLRQKYPGRYALDMALRDALGTKDADPTLWRKKLSLDLHEWRCGYRVWKDEDREPVSLDRDLLLRARLQQELSKAPREQAVRRACDIAGAPLRFVELVNLLAKLWNVEVPYRTPLVRLLPLHSESDLPEVATLRRAALGELWDGLVLLSQPQCIAILLHDEGFAALLEMQERDVVARATVAEKLAIPENVLEALLEGPALSDTTIARAFGLDVSRVRGLRQDGYRRLERYLRRKKSDAD